MTTKKAKELEHIIRKCHLYYAHDDEYQTDQYGPPCTLCSGYNHSPKHCFKGEHDINDIMEKMNIPKGEHNDPHELPQQQDLEGSTKIYSHADTTMPTPNSSQKLKYIYQHFQENEKVYESDPKLAIDEIDSTLYRYINNDIEYGLFEDVIDSHYLDSQI